MREEIAEIIKQGRTGVTITSNGIANFIEYPISSDESADQILALVKAKLQASLLTDEEIIDATANELGRFAVAQAQLAKSLKALEEK